MSGASPPTTRLAYEPALDGLRAVAVVAVLVHHHSPEHLRGGFLGVSLFFTLSGFLITRLLLAEHRSSGRIGLRSFWVRRARRILPMAWLGLALATVVVLVEPAANRARHLTDIRSALVSVLNWRFIATNAPYADIGLEPSPVQHYWSLAVEEQFYLVFPLLVIACVGRRRLLVAVLGAAAGLSLLQQLRLDGVDRIYFGTDTRAGELAVGALLALAHPWLAAHVLRRDRRLDVIGWSALAATLVLFWRLPLSAPALVGGGFLALSLLWAQVLLAASAPGSVAAALGTRPLVRVGQLSYALYVLHVPVYRLVTGDRVGVDGPPLLVTRLGVCLLFALVAHRLIERPVRERRRLVGRTAVVALPLAVVALIVPAALMPIPDAPQVKAGMAFVPPPSAATATAATAAAGASDDDDSARRPAEPDAGSAERTTTSPPESRPPEAPAATRPARPLRLLVLGDSTAGFNGAGLRDWGAESGTLDVTIASGPGCAVLAGSRVQVREGLVHDATCGHFASTVLDHIADVRPDAVVMFVGSPQLALWDFGDGAFTGLDSPPVALEYERALTRLVDTLDAGEVPVLWADVPLPAWDLDEWDRATGQISPGSGPVTMNDEGRWTVLSAIDTRVLAGRRMVARWPYVASLSGADGQLDPSARFDGLHVGGPVARRLAEQVWTPALRAAYAEVVAEVPGRPAWPAPAG